jgi:carbonic anhydrase/acetyltransferase-like protein (isoleucine patch superfamily)
VKEIGLMIKMMIKRLLYGPKASPDTYVRYLRECGSTVGERTTFYEPRSNCIDTTRPFLLKIGDDVQITRGVCILTHGYDWSVLKHCYGDVLGSAGKVEIGNNVFIGMNTIILKSVKIGDNVIIGAGSLVNKDIPDNCVYAGNPAKFITTIDEYYKKRLSVQLEEAKELAVEYFNRYHELPPQDCLHEFFWLFSKKDKPLRPKFKSMMKLTGNYAQSMEAFDKHNPVFENYRDFLKYCGLEKNHG